MGESVSLKEMRATLDQHGRNGRLATGDAARQSYAQHGHIRNIAKLKAGASMSRLALMQYIHVVCARLCLTRGQQSHPLPTAQLGCFHRVAHQHGDGEWADAAGHGSECSCNLGDFRMNVAHQS